MEHTATSFGEMTLKQLRRIQWLTHDNRRIRIGDLSDDHLANIIDHCAKNIGPYSEPFVMKLREEAASRNLTQKFLDCAPIPWQADDGKWKQFNYDTQQYEVIGR